MAEQNTPGSIIDCACVIHGTGYDWIYVERLYNMLHRHLSGGIRFHVYTEPDREVPGHMIKHDLDLWPGIGGPRKSWWYKMQLFNPKHHQGNLLYFDLDVVILQNLDWIVSASTDYFWTIRDFKYLQKPTWTGMNSSLMWWNVNQFGWVWDQFSQNDIATTTRHYQGDQDFLDATITQPHKRMFDNRYVQSWRWQVSDGGMNFRTRLAKQPGAGAVLSPDTSIVIFHGRPNPHEVTDPVIVANWC